MYVTAYYTSVTKTINDFLACEINILFNKGHSVPLLSCKAVSWTCRIHLHDKICTRNFLRGTQNVKLNTIVNPYTELLMSPTPHLGNVPSRELSISWTPFLVNSPSPELPMSCTPHLQNSPSRELPISSTLYAVNPRPNISSHKKEGKKIFLQKPVLIRPDMYRHV